MKGWNYPYIWLGIYLGKRPRLDQLYGTGALERI
jgi:hypothetical protein